MDISKLSAPFPSTSISWRVGATNKEKTKCIALAYIDARDVMERLDAVVGPQDWQALYPHANGKTSCKIGINFNGEWVWKENGCGDSQVEAEKGAFSDAFKRSAVLWGIGRYLYDMPNIWVKMDEWKQIDKSEISKLIAAHEKLAGGQAAKQPENAATYFTNERDARAAQYDICNRISVCASREELQTILQSVKEMREALLDDYPALSEYVEQVIENAATATFDPNAPKVVKFAGVEHAVKWITEAGQFIDETNDEFVIRKWMGENAPYIEAVDKTLSAEKYKKEGKTPSERLQSKIQSKLVKEKA